MVKYTYDAWGNCRVLNPDGTENTEPTFVGNRNPFRYRGYYFDTETGLYFLKTRYYDPAIGRFMTLDDFAYLDPDHVNGLNLYAYCNNNPVMFSDPTGHMPEWLETALYFAGGVLIIASCVALALLLPVVSAPLAFIAAGAAIGAITGGVAGVISTLIAGGDIHDAGQAFFFGTVTGAISGAIAASPLKVGGQMVANALLNVCSYIITQSINGDPITFGGVMMNVVTGVAAGYLGKNGWLSDTNVTNVVRAGLKNFMGEAFKQVGAKSIAYFVLPGILLGGLVNGAYSRFTPAYRPENGFWNW